MGFEKPPARSAPERSENLDQMQRELARIDMVYREHIATRTDLSAEAKEFVLNHMREHPEREWGQVDGEEVMVHSVEKLEDGSIAVQIACYGMLVDQRVIPIPAELR